MDKQSRDTSVIKGGDNKVWKSKAVTKALPLAREHRWGHTHSSISQGPPEIDELAALSGFSRVEGFTGDLRFCICGCYASGL